MQISICRSEQHFYVYEHIRKDTGAIFYVGKGKGGRASAHVSRNTYWKRIVAKSGGFDICYVANDLDEELAFLLEVERIDQLKKIGVNLCNMTIGGDGIIGLVVTDEHKRKIGNAHRGKTISDEVRRKISLAVKASGYKHSEEARRKMSIAHKGKKRALGYKHTDEWKKRMSEMRKGKKLNREYKPRSEEAKKAVSDALSGKSQSIKTCPHCSKSGGNAMLRWHFDKCRAKQ